MKIDREGKYIKEETWELQVSLVASLKKNSKRWNNKYSQPDLLNGLSIPFG